MSNILRIENDYSFFLSTDYQSKHEIWDRLRFRDRNYFHNRAYKMRKWDGYIQFFALETGKFLTGLLPEVTAVLKHFNVQYTVEDNRNKTPFMFHEIGTNFLNQWLPAKNLNGDPMKPITLHDYQVELVNQVIKHRRGVIYAPTSAGKAQPLDSLVATPTGFRQMGDLRVNDLVLVPSGGAARILGVYPQGKKPIVRVVFSNGDSVECCEDHLWKVNALYDQWRGKILSAKAMMPRIKCPNGASRFNIDTPCRVDFQTQNLPLPPYFLGLLLGDGTFRCPGAIGISTIEPEILEYISSQLPIGYKLRRSKSRKCDYRITSGKRGKGTPKNPYVSVIEKLGLMGLRSYEKYVPEQYLVNNSECRLELLRGLMDTDGEVDKKGRIAFTSTSIRLAEAVAWLVHSLGGVAYRSTVKKFYRYKGKKKIGRLAHIVRLTLPVDVKPFHLTWKSDRVKLVRTKNGHRTISSISPIGEKECQCIMIDHPDHLYMTDGFVITHNTFIMLGILKSIPPGTPTLILQNRLTLAQQNYDELSNWGFPNIGTLWGGACNPNIITVASVQSIAKIEKLLPKIRVLIVDEIHDMMSALPKAVYRRLKSADIRVAVSATPFKFGGKDNVQKFHVRGFFGPILKVKSTPGGVLTTAELQERGILSNSKCIFYPITEPMIPHDIYIDAVTRGIAESYHFHKVVTRLAKKQEGRTLILVDRIAHGDALHNLLPGSIWVQGKDTAKTRKSVIRKLQKDEKCLAIATQQIFNTGVNFHVHTIINAAGGQADHQIIQRMGRGLRTASDKTMLNYYDFLFKINDYLEDHSKKRIEILKKEGHEVIVKDDIDF